MTPEKPHSLHGEIHNLRTSLTHQIAVSAVTTTNNLKCELGNMFEEITQTHLASLAEVTARVSANGAAVASVIHSVDEKVEEKVRSFVTSEIEPIVRANVEKNIASISENKIKDLVGAEIAEIKNKNKMLKTKVNKCMEMLKKQKKGIGKTTGSTE